MTNESKGFSITVCLKCFFRDHRAISRIFVSRDCKSIEDLINHIKKVFDIEVDIALLFEDQYLPLKEDICILERNDTVQVIITKKEDRKQFQSNGNGDFQSNFSPPKKKRKYACKDETYVSETGRNGSTEIVPVPDDNCNILEEPKRIKKNKKCRLKSQPEDYKTCINENNEEDILIRCNVSLGNIFSHDNYYDIEPKTIEKKLKKNKKRHDEESDGNIDNKNPNEKSALEFEKKHLPNRFEKKSEVKVLENIKVNNNLHKYGENDRNATYTPPMNLYRYKRKFDSLGNTLNLLRRNDSTDREDIEEPEISIPNELALVKRKRYRVRHRKKKVPIAELDSTMNTKSNLLEYIPPKTCASPKLHIRFEPETEENNKLSNLGSESANEENAEEIFDLMEKIEQEKMDPAINEKLIIAENDVFCNQMNEQMAKQFPIIDSAASPQKDDVICFKILRMDNNFCPVISNIITAHVLEFSSGSRALNVRILAGRDQCEEPIGKLILPEEETDVQKEKDKGCCLEFNWNNLIEPRLVFP